MELKFQENFLWGAAKSGPQTEGRFKNSMTMFLIMILTIIKSASGEQ